MSASEQQVATACIALVNAQLSAYGDGGVHAFDLDDARGVTAEHVQVTLTPRFSATERGGMAASSPWRLTTRPVGSTVGNARELARRTRVALDGVRVIAAGETSTPIRLESSDAIGEDDGYYSGLTTWTFVL